MAGSLHGNEPEDLSWSEVGALALRYGRIPLALLCVEALYWFLTMPSDTLAPIQVTEAWLWNGITNLLYGQGSSTLSYHNDWLTRIDFHHVSFPGPMNSVGLYVSDECAGIHEMIFLSTLVMMTDGVPQKFKLKSIAIMCVIIYLLNLMRLILFYPIALEDCLANPDQQICLQGMWNFHQMVYEWGFLVVLVGMWLVWFLKFGGPARTLSASKFSNEPWRIRIRSSFKSQHLAIIGVALLFLLLAFYSMTTNDEAVAAKETLEWCEFSNLISSECGDAQQQWDDAIGYAWSLSALSLIAITGTCTVYERRLADGSWPNEANELREPEDSQQLETPTKGHHTKKEGSWKRRREEE